MKRVLLLLALLPYFSFAQITITGKAEKRKENFPIVGKKTTATIVCAAQENVLVNKAANFLASDIEKVSGKKPEVVQADATLSGNIVLVGTVGNNPLINKLVEAKKLNVKQIKGQWERFIIKTIDKPFPNVKQALVIVGSDRRGAAYGVFSISEKMGVSPWHYWADAPVQTKEEIYLKKGEFVSKSPSVKYRGIFINDEAPALRNWAKEKFGDLNHKFYEHVFELLLRNKANYIWPAMWLPTMFYVDDPLNPKVADEYGIVVSTSHHEPFTRAHNEWYRDGKGPWNYEHNKEKLQEFWRKGAERMVNYETAITVGMRGDGDEAMSEETAVDLLKEIITDQREILADVTGKPAQETPQVWAVYKEVQDYYDKGMRVEDDITVLFCDDNWGNLRILPKKNRTEKTKYGIYYHFDYVGGPVSYKWLNTTQIERVWEQMNLAYQFGVKDLWLVNVGDIKPMELPISFFMDFAYDTDAIQAKDLPNYYVNWAKQQFGAKHAKEIADFLALYTKYNARRTPEMLTAETYSIENYREADRVVKEYNDLLERSTKVYNALPEETKAAYYQLVQSPIEFCANLNEMYVAAGKNKYYAEHGSAAANYYAEKVKELFAKDAKITRNYHELKDGKWNHMMSQTHIGYTYWNHPPLNKMPAVSYVQIQKEAELGYLIENGAKPKWGYLDVEADWYFGNTMPEFDAINEQDYYLDIINRGEEKLTYSVNAKEDWIKLSSKKGTVQFHEKVYVSIDWAKAPKGKATGEIVIAGAGEEHSVKVPIRNEKPEMAGFVENAGVVAFEASNFSRKTDAKKMYWSVVENLGRTGSSVIAEPVTINRQKVGKKTPRLEYDFSVFEAGELNIEVFHSPTQDFKKTDGLWYAIAIDDAEPQLINMNKGEDVPDYKYPDWWNNSVGDHIKTSLSKHNVKEAGKHTLKIWMLDAGVVFQKIVIDAGGKKKSYLGAPESKKLNATETTLR